MAEPKPLEVEYASMKARLSGKQSATLRLLAIERAHRRASPTGTLLSERKVAIAIDSDRGYARKVLIRLEQLGVFECTLRGAGRRPNAYRIAPLEDWRCLSQSQRDAAVMRAEKVAVSRETGTNGTVVIPPSTAQAFVDVSFRHAQDGGCAEQEDTSGGDVVRDGSTSQTQSKRVGTHISSGGRALTPESEAHSQPVIDVIERRTALLGWPRNAVAASCEDLDDDQVHELAERVNACGLKTATKLAEYVDAEAPKILTKPRPRPPAVFEPDDFGKAAPPDFSGLRARLRETAAVEATS